MGELLHLTLVGVIYCQLFFNFSYSSFTYWNFTSVNLPEDVFISKFAVWKNRVFFAVPRLLENLTNHPTLLEATWPENGNTFSFLRKINSNVKSFPNYDFKVFDKNCNNLQSVVGLDIDSRHLWILDVPRQNCTAKIVIYDLFLNDKEITKIYLIGIPKKDLNTLVVDPVIDLHGPKAYIGDPGDESIIVFNLYQRRWWKLKLEHGPEIPKVYSADMALSRKSSILYLTGYHTHDLFSVNIEKIRKQNSLQLTLISENYKNTSVKWLGKKLGYSSGLICDHENGLHYFLTTEHASVRWNVKHSLQAEGHAIRLQSEHVPYITHYIIDSQRNVWGIVNSWFPLEPEAKKFTLNSRTVKINKYTILGP